MVQEWLEIYSDLWLVEMGELFAHTNFRSTLTILKPSKSEHLVPCK